MELCAVALVLFKAVLGVLLRVFEHQAIPADLRQNRRGGDRHRPRVTLYDILGGDIQRRQTVAVDHGVIRLDGQPLDRALHRVHGRLQDIVALDLFDRSESDGAGNSLFNDNVKERVALLLGQLLTIVHALDDTALGQDNGGGAHRTRQRSSARFINAADMVKAFRSRFVLKM